MVDDADHTGIGRHLIGQKRVGRLPAAHVDHDFGRAGADGIHRDEGFADFAQSGIKGAQHEQLVPGQAFLLVGADDAAHHAREVHFLSILIVSTIPMIAASTGVSFVRVVMRADEPETTRTVSVYPALTVSTATTGLPESPPEGSSGWTTSSLNPSSRSSLRVATMVPRIRARNIHDPLRPQPRFVLPIGRRSSRLACGLGMTCTETSSPTLRAAAAPASVAAFTAATSPRTMVVTRPEPIFS